MSFDLGIPGLTIVTPDKPLPPRRLFTCIYGDPGAGKTSLSFTAEGALHFDFDQGVARAAVRGTSLQFDNVYDDKKRLVKTGFEACLELVSNTDNFNKVIEHYGTRTIVLDTGGTLLDNGMMPYIFHKYPKYRQADGAATLKGYGALKSTFKSFLQMLFQHDLDVVMICHAQEKDERMQPKMTGSSLDIVKEMADMLGYLKMEGTTRVLDFRPTDDHFGKNTAQFDPVPIPDYKDDTYDGLLSRLIETTRKKMSSLSADQQQAVVDFEAALDELTAELTFDELFERWKSAGEMQPTFRASLRAKCVELYVGLYAAEHFINIESAEQANTVMKAAGQLPTPFKRPIGNKLLEHCTQSLGYTYKKDTLFTDPNAKAADEKKKKATPKAEEKEEAEQAES